MPKYRVRDGQQLPHIGHIYEAGEVVELPVEIAADSFVAGRVEAVDAPKPVVPQRQATTSIPASPVDSKGVK